MLILDQMESNPQGEKCHSGSQPNLSSIETITTLLLVTATTALPCSREQYKFLATRRKIFQLYFGFGDVSMPDLFHTDRTVSKSIVALQHHLAMGESG